MRWRPSPRPCNARNVRSSACFRSSAAGSMPRSTTRAPDMVGPAKEREWPGVDAFVEAYESAQARDGRAELADFAPPAEHPERLAILCELVRVDLEHHWRR